jgi:hypothetical protein
LNSRTFFVQERRRRQLATKRYKCWRRY